MQNAFTPGQADYIAKLNELWEAAAHIYGGVYVADPTTRPDGSAMQVGDEYFNALDNVTRRWNGAAWLVSYLDTALLAGTGGAANVGYDGGTVQDVVDAAKPMASYAALRAYTGRATGVRITQQGIAGFFSRSLTDTTSADDGGTMIIDGSGRRWLRLYSGEVSVKWFGATGDGATTDTAAFVAAALTGKRIYVPAGVYIVVHSNIVCADGTEFYGEGTLKDLSTPTVTSGNPNFGFIRVTTNNKVSGLSFIGAGNKLFAVTGQSSTSKGTVRNIRVSGLTTTQCGTFITEPEQGFTFNRTDEAFVNWITSGPVTADMIAHDIVVRDCSMAGDATYTPAAGNCNSSQAHGVAFLYAEDCESINNHVRNARFGNWSYGGGPVASDGYSVSANATLNKNISFIGGSAREVYSSYWMSRTDAGVIQGTTSIDFDDVTLDFEGCSNCVAQGNVTNDIGHGGGVMTALFGCTGIDFIGNTCLISAGASTNMVNSYIGNEHVNYAHNILRATGSATPKVIIRNKTSAVGTLSPDASRYINFDFNTLVNVDVLFEDIDVCSFRGNRQLTATNVNAARFFNCPDMEYAGNTLTLTADSALAGQGNSPVQFILSGMSFNSVDIHDNKVIGTTGESGITVFGNQSATCVATVNRNRANAIFLDNSWVFSVTNQLRGRVAFEGNILPSAKDTAHIGAAVLKSISGSESANPFMTVSNAPPGVGTWKVGDRVRKQTPTASGPSEWICTVAGTPGTWKDAAAISA